MLVELLELIEILLHLVGVRRRAEHETRSGPDDVGLVELDRDFRVRLELFLAAEAGDVSDFLGRWRARVLAGTFVVLLVILDGLCFLFFGCVARRTQRLPNDSLLSLRPTLSSTLPPAADDFVSFLLLQHFHRLLLVFVLGEI